MTDETNIPRPSQFWALVETKEALENGSVAFGITFPDMTNVFGAADSENEIASCAIEALQLHLDDWPETEPFPIARTLKELLATEEVKLAMADGHLLIPVPYLSGDMMDTAADALFAQLMGDDDDEEDDDEDDPRYDEFGQPIPGMIFESPDGTKVLFAGSLEYEAILYHNDDLGVWRAALSGHQDIAVDGSVDDVVDKLMNTILESVPRTTDMDNWKDAYPTVVPALPLTVQSERAFDSEGFAFKSVVPCKMQIMFGAPEIH